MKIYEHIEKAEIYKYVDELKRENADLQRQVDSYQQLLDSLQKPVDSYQKALVNTPRETKYYRDILFDMAFLIISHESFTMLEENNDE